MCRGKDCSEVWILFNQSIGTVKVGITLKSKKSKSLLYTLLCINSILRYCNELTWYNSRILVFLDIAFLGTHSSILKEKRHNWDYILLCSFYRYVKWSTLGFFWCISIEYRVMYKLHHYFRLLSKQLVLQLTLERYFEWNICSIAVFYNIAV